MDIALNAAFIIGILQIIAIDILLGGDNAVMIALASRNLPNHQRKQAIMWGIMGAIVLRFVFVFCATFLLQIPFVKLIGALLLLWIGVKLILPEKEEDLSHVKASDHLFSAIKTIIIADAVMSLDNVVGISAAANGHMALVLFGILLSVP
ncbi:MAG: TerC family protein, partial [Burkholderiales bacterium]|nr:TerC family protein [Burkholderiales bacterium]